MGNSIFRNRFWYYRSVYDDYMMREIRLTFGIAGIVWLPFYWWGVHLNRAIETNYSHKNYVTEYMPRRNRLTHSLLFEEFETIVERWQLLNEQFETKKDEMIEEFEKGLPEALQQPVKVEVKHN